jgi:hypothetical protein
MEAPNWRNPEHGAGPGSPEDGLTAPQRRYLAEIREAGTRTYNGRARRTLETLQDAGLIEVEYDQRAQSKGNGIELAERFICTATEQG